MKRLAQVLVQDEVPLLHHGEVLWRNGKRVSEIRSASYAHTLGGAIGLCMLESERDPIDKPYITDGDWSIEIGTKMYHGIDSRSETDWNWHCGRWCCVTQWNLIDRSAETPFKLCDI